MLLTGLSPRVAGAYFQRRTASSAAWRNIGGPEMAFALTTLPAVSTSTVTTTWPSKRNCRAIAGYWGGTEEISRAGVDFFWTIASGARTAACFAGVETTLLNSVDRESEIGVRRGRATGSSPASSLAVRAAFTDEPWCTATSVVVAVSGPAISVGFTASLVFAGGATSGNWPLSLPATDAVEEAALS